MRRVITFVFAAAIATSAPGFAQSRTVDRTISLNPGGSLSLEATKGSVRLVAWNRAEVQIKARIEAGDNFSGDEEYAGQAVAATQVDVSGDATSVRIRSNYDAVPERDRGPWGSGRSIPDVHYEIRAPGRVDLTLDIDRSNADISGFDGRVRIDSDRGELLVRDVSGDLRVDIDRGGSSRFENVSGSFSLEGDRTDLDITVARLTESSHLELDRGDARVRVAEGQALTVKTDIERRGSFESDVPMQLQGGTEKSPEGTINGGGPTLTVVAHRARVRLAPMR